jgi:O-antigen/teichoic acid export membrane protein
MIIKKVLKNISWLVFDKFATLLVGLIVIVKVANHYGPTEYGLYQYAVSINLLLGVIVLFVDGRVVKKLYPDTDEGLVIYNTTIAKVILSFISLIIGILILFVLGKGFKFNSIYIILLINNIVLNLAFGFQNFFEYHLKSKNVVIASNIANVTSAIFQLTAVALSFSIISIAAIIFISSIIKLLILYFQFKKSFSVKIVTKVDKLLISAIIRESVPLAIAATAATVYTRVDQVMIGTMLDVDEVGIYSISVQMVSVVLMIISPIQVSVFPRMLEWYNSNRDYYYSKYQALTSLMTWMSILGILASFVFAPILFDLFFSDSYSESVNVFKIHVIGTFFMYNAVLRSSHFTLTKGTHILMISQIVALFLNVGLNFVLIPKIGIYGAAIATVVTQFSSLFLSNLFFKDGKEVFGIQLSGLNPINIYKGFKLKELH